MEVDDKLIDYLQNLTRLELSGGEREKTKRGLEKILEYVSILKDAPVSDNDKLIFISEKELRSDDVITSFQREDILKNAPRKSDEFFIADKAVEG